MVPYPIYYLWLTTAVCRYLQYLHDSRTELRAAEGGNYENSLMQERHVTAKCNAEAAWLRPLEACVTTAADVYPSDDDDGDDGDEGWGLEFH